LFAVTASFLRRMKKVCPSHYREKQTSRLFPVLYKIYSAHTRRKQHRLPLMRPAELRLIALFVSGNCIIPAPHEKRSAPHIIVKSRPHACFLSFTRYIAKIPAVNNTAFR